MQFGKSKTMLTIRDHYFEGNIDSTILQKTVRVKIADVQTETKTFLEFTDNIRELRASDVLTYDPEDKSTLPSFTIQYPRIDKGSYFIILNWCETVVKSD